MGRTIGVSGLLSKKYKAYDLSEEWRNVIGNPEHNFKMIVWGPSGHGKTTFALKLCKELSRFGKVYYNSIEQGEGKSLQDVAKHCNLEECKGRMTFGDRDTFDEMVDKLKRNRARFCVIDSVQYLSLTVGQYKQLIEMFPRKAFVFISWEGAAGLPKGEHAKAIRYMVCIKVHVRNAIANANSRFGATKPYRIFEKPVVQGDQVAMPLHMN